MLYFCTQLLHGSNAGWEQFSKKTSEYNNERLLDEATDLLQDCFEIVPDPESGNDLIPGMVGVSLYTT
jgi:hypothetical protein